MYGLRTAARSLPPLYTSLQLLEYFSDHSYFGLVLTGCYINPYKAHLKIVELKGTLPYVKLKGLDKIWDLGFGIISHRRNRENLRHPFKDLRCCSHRRDRRHRAIDSRWLSITSIDFDIFQLRHYLTILSTVYQLYLATLFYSLSTETILSDLTSNISQVRMPCCIPPP